MHGTRACARSSSRPGSPWLMSRGPRCSQATGSTRKPRPPSNVRSRSMPRLFDAHYYYARFLVTQGDHAGAVRHYEAAFAIQPGRLPAGHHGDPGVSGARRPRGRASAPSSGPGPRSSDAWRSIRTTPPPTITAPACWHCSGGRTSRAASASGPWRCARTIRRPTTTPPAPRRCRASTRRRSICSSAPSPSAGPMRRWLMNDNDLVPLHDHPRFKQIVAELA